MKTQGLALTKRSNQAAQTTTPDAVTMKAIKTAVTTAVAVATTILLVNIVDVPKIETEPPVLSTASVQEVQPEIVPVAPAETVTEPAPQTVALPEPAPQPVVETPAVANNCDLASGYNWPVDVARAICMAESSGNANAHNAADGHATCTGSYGLYQIGCFWADFYGITIESLYDPAVNTEIAHRIYQRTGSFYPWTTWTGGAYKQYL